MAEKADSPIDDGGSAFPVECDWSTGKPVGMQTGNTAGWATGMSLRAYFAAQALSGLCARMSSVCYSDISNELRVGQQEAKVAVALADALIAELKAK